MKDPLRHLSYWNGYLAATEEVGKFTHNLMGRVKMLPIKDIDLLMEYVELHADMLLKATSASVEQGGDVIAADKPHESGQGSRNKGYDIPSD